MSTGSLTVNKGHLPVGYVTPPFPSLSLRIISGNPYQVRYLYSTWDIWRFTVYWFLILSVGVHLTAAGVAAVMYRRPLGSLVILLTYCILGAVFAFAVGSVTGIILAAIYTADGLHMSTWVPFGWAALTMVSLALAGFTTNVYTM